MQISIITATYNSAETVSDCIKSVKYQTYKNIEHIIIDGASKDNTLEIVESMAHKETRIISESDNGIYDALNKALRIANGDIVGFLHSDDLFNSNETIEEVMNIFDTKNVSGVYGDLVYVNREKPDRVIRYWKSKPFTRRSLKFGWMPAHPTLFLKKDVYVEHGDFELEYRISADYDFILRILQDSSLQFEYLPKVITKMRSGGASNRSLGNILLKSKEDLKAIRKYKVGGILTLILKNARKTLQFIQR
jgi:glycosyltransferase